MCCVNVTPMKTRLGHEMSYRPSLLLNSVIGGMAVTVGLWFLLGDLSQSVSILTVAGCTVVFIRICPTIAHVWMYTTFLLGIESIAWPLQMMGELRSLGPEPPMEDMQRIFTAVLFGMFSGVFWLTFAYGIYRRTRPKLDPPVSVPLTPNQAKAKRKKGR